MNRLPLHGGGLAEACRVHGGRPADWLDLSTGINPNPMAVGDIPAEAWQRLPDADLSAAARQAAANCYRTGDPVLPLPVPGTQAAIQCLPRLLGPGRRVAIAGPTYNEYARVFGAAGWMVETVNRVDDVAGADVGILVNPNNPDGRAISRAHILRIADRMAESGATLVVDEAFADLAPEISVADAAGGHCGLVVLRSFGKFFGLAGLRLGFVVAASGRLAALERMLGPWPVSGPALSVAARVLSDEDAIARMRASIRERSAAMRRVLEAAGLPVVGDGGLFLLVTHPDAAAIYMHLCRRHILVRAFDYRADWLRFGLAPNAAGDARLADALAEMRIS